MDTHFYALRVHAVEPDTDEAVIVSFDVPTELRERFAFTQGQYLTLRMKIEDKELRRSYSVCAGVGDDLLRIGVRKVRGGVFSNWIAQSLRAGDSIEIMPPQGRFYVPVDARASRHYLGIAGGSGITPVLSILKTVLTHEPRSRFTLLYGNRGLRSTMFKEELEDLKNRFLARFQLHYVFSDEHSDSALHQGVLDAERVGAFLQRLVPASTIDHAFVCGPYQMNDQAETALLAAGVSPERIHIERFGVAPGSDAGQAQAAGAVMHHAEMRDPPLARVTIHRDGLSHTVDFHQGDPSILDVAGSAGLDLPYSCTSGVCGTCRARLLCGEVRMDRNFALEKSDLAAGFILACQAHPLTEKVEISFDER